MATVEVPGVGPVDKRVMVGLGVAVAAGTGYVYWRRSHAVDAAPAVASFDETSLTDTGEYGGGAAWKYAATPTGDVVDTSGTAAPRTNPEWSQRANEALIGAGYPTLAVAAALGKYLGRQPLTADETIMIRAALGFVGNPPDGSYAVVGSPVTATPTPAKPATPAAPAAPSSASVTLVGTDRAQLRWTAVKGAIGYSVWRNGAHYGTTLSTALNVTGLTRGRANTLEVAATNGGGRWSARKRVTFTTKK